MSTLSSAASENTLYHQGKNCLSEKKYDLAIVRFNQYLKINPNHPEALSQLAFCYRTTRKYPLALTAYRQALRLLPDHPEFLIGMANCYKNLGNFDKASGYYEKVLKVKSGKIDLFHSLALYNLTLINDYPLNAPLVRELQQRHATMSAGDRSRVQFCFALGKIYEHHGKHQEAFEYYAEGNRLEFSHLAYDEKDWFSYYDAIESVFNADLLARLNDSGSQDQTPIFVLGMPRCGSTLVEQILASHSAVCGVDEDDILPRIAERMIPQMTGLPYPQAINTLEPKAFAPVAEQFLQELRSYCPDNNRLRIVTKTLANYFHVGLIRLLFPRAAIIHCVRDPMDTCWSMFRHHFGGNIPYCYDQTALGNHFCRYHKLMHHWHTVLPGAIHEIAYERLIKEPRTTIHALLGYCGLAFEENCLSFYRTNRPVSTASARQVRRPIYTSSLRSWEPVADKLLPLRRALGHSA